MGTPTITKAEARRRFAALHKALEMGHKPPSVAVNARNGERGALSVALTLAGGHAVNNGLTWLKAAERVLGAFPWPAYDEEEEPAPPQIVAQPIPGAEPTYDELKARLISDFGRKREHHEAVRLLTVRVTIPGPYGVLVMGDPHMDDGGTDWPMIDRDVRLVQRTAGLFVANVGDLTNNWVGRLARLYADQSITRAQAIILAEGFIRELRGKWLWIDGGNHDVWSGADDPLLWIARQSNVVYQWHGNRLNLVSPNGQSVIVNSRHDHPGWSMWNPTHGPLKAAQMDALHDDIYTCGHLHTGAYQLFPQPNIGTVSHLFRASGYKIYDHYAEAKGLTSRHLPRGVFLIDPDRPRRDRVQFFADPEWAADVLTHLRSKHDGVAYVSGATVARNASKHPARRAGKAAKPAHRRVVAGAA